jgi:class 3 adenylate cyclase
MQEQIREIYSWRQSHGEKVMDIVISINTGEAIFGNIGSGKRMVYTLLSNVINMAFRLREMLRGAY